MSEAGRLQRSLVLAIVVGALFFACSKTAEGLSVGDRAPQFSLPAADGHTVSLSDFAGKQDVLLYFNMGYV